MGFHSALNNHLSVAISCHLNGWSLTTGLLYFYAPSTLQGEYEESLKRNEKRNQFLSHQSKTVHDLSEDLRIIDRKIKALQHIISVKSHPATVKKIFFQGYTPGERIDFRGRRPVLLISFMPRLRHI